MESWELNGCWTEIKEWEILQKPPLGNGIRNFGIWNLIGTESIQPFSGSIFLQDKLQTTCIYIHIQYVHHYISLQYQHYQSLLTIICIINDNFHWLIAGNITNTVGAVGYVHEQLFSSFKNLILC